MGSPVNAGLNNPGNLRKSIDLFKGEVVPSKSPSFKQFKSADYGFRAMAVILLTYLKNYNADTISKIITRYAPPSENNTKSYIDFVVKETGIAKDEQLSFADFISAGDSKYKKIIRAMAWLEQGKKPDETALTNGYKLFLNEKFKIA